MACKIGAIVYSILQFVAFLFVLVGTPIDQFRSKGGDLVGNTGCLTLWGYKTKCYSTKLDDKLDDVFAACKERKTHFKAAEGMAIISIIVFGVACLFGFIRLCCCNCFRWVCLVLNIVGLVTALVVWALMANSYLTDEDCFISTWGGKLKTGAKYGGGFALIVVGWLLNTINIIFIAIPC